MALPAQEPLAVPAHIDPRNGDVRSPKPGIRRRDSGLGFPNAAAALGAPLRTPDSRRPGDTLCVALAAELARGRLGRRVRSRHVPVLIGGLVASRARNRRVSRRGFRARDLAVAGRAARGQRRRRRRVRRVTGDAGLSRVVRGGFDLREPGGTRRVVAVAARAEVALARHARRRLGRVRHVRRSRPVAGFTADELVTAPAVYLDDVLVAVGARFASGILDGPCGDLRDRSCAVVSYLPEGHRDQVVPRDKERDGKEDEQHEQPRDLLRDARPPVTTGV